MLSILLALSVGSGFHAKSVKQVSAGGTSYPVLQLSYPTTGYFVSPTGSSNNAGTYAAPWSLGKALGMKSTVVATNGDTIWILPGSYDTNTYYATIETDRKMLFNLKSTDSNAPVKIRAYPDTSIPTIYGGPWLDTKNSNLWWMDLRTSCYDTHRSSTNSGDAPPDLLNVNGFEVRAMNTKTINLYIDNWIKAGMTSFTVDGWTEHNSDLVFYNGSTSANRANGQAIYTHNAPAIGTGGRLFRHCIYHNNFLQQIQMYGGGQAVNFTWDGMICMQSALMTNTGTTALFQGGLPVTNLTVINCLFAQNDPNGLQFGGVAIGDGCVTNNGIVWTNNYSMVPISLGDWTGGTSVFSNNVFGVKKQGTVSSNQRLITRLCHDATVPPLYGFDYNDYMILQGDTKPFTVYTNDPSGRTDYTFTTWKSTFSIDSNSIYTNSSIARGFRTWVQTNDYWDVYSRKFAQVAIVNFGVQTNNIDIPFDGVMPYATYYYVRNATDPYGSDVASGRFLGGNISFPMTNQPVAAPNAWTSPPGTGTNFNVFLVYARP